jgi:Ca2+-transporting ATPase
MNNRDWHTLSRDELTELLKTSVNGLTSQEAKSRLLKFGQNQLKASKKISPLRIFLSQFKSFLILILIMASGVSSILGHFLETVAILLIVVMAAALGFIQEYRAERALEALKKMAALLALVVRDNQQQEIRAQELVPGDLILLTAGDKTPADCRLIEAINLKIEEAALTGESAPVEKFSQPIQDTEVSLPERKNMGYMGTTVTYGKAKAIVVATGMQTEFGKIAGMLAEIEEKRTPLQVAVDKLGKWLGVLTLAVCILVAFLGILRGHKILEMFVWGVSLAVAAVPESLPAVITACLALGVRRMVRRNALIRRLPAVETLGCVSVICSDKTGTLTQDEMTVCKIYFDHKLIEVTGAGYASKGELLFNGRALNPQDERHLSLLIKGYYLCNDSSIIDDKDGKQKIKGDPTEVALKVLALKAGLKINEISLEEPRIDEISFSSERKRMTTIHKSSSGIFAYSKGAPEIILEDCNYIYRDGQEIKLESKDKEYILEKTKDLAKDALRVLSLSYRSLSSSYQKEQAEKEMVFLGLVGIMDPPRPEAKKAILACQSAGIKPIMITGDHKLTAEAVAKELGILKANESILTGKELESIKDEEFLPLVENITVYARVEPVHKMRIVDALSSRGHIVAMTGDGVNDAPALKKADIGVAMGITGTDVSKEASDMILIDDNFASIVRAVEEGRTIFANIRKFLVYLLTDNLGAILVYVVALLKGLPLPLTALQILFINLIMDGPKAISLGLEPPEPDIMKRPPRNPNENILNRPSLFYIFTVGFLIMAVTFGIFNWSLKDGKPYAMTMFFAGLIIVRTFNAFNCRSITVSLFKLGLFTNRWLLAAAAVTVLTSLPIIYVPSMQKIFKTVPLSLNDWTLLILVSSTTLIFVEIIKYLRWIKAKSKRFSNTGSTDFGYKVSRDSAKR